MKPIPINEAAAEKMLLDEYTRVMGKKPDMPVEMVCKMSAPRLLLGEEWRWVKLENKNWRAQLQFGPENVKVMAHPLAGANVDRGDEVEIRWKHGKLRG